MIEHWMETDLKKMPCVQQLPGRFFSQDEDANKIGVILTDGGEAVEISGSVVASVVRGNGTTLTVSGDSDSNRAWVVLPDDAYAVIGKIGIFIKLETATEVTTIGAVECQVR